MKEKKFKLVWTRPIYGKSVVCAKDEGKARRKGMANEDTDFEEMDDACDDDWQLADVIEIED
jgi:hypothetical protein